MNRLSLSAERKAGEMPPTPYVPLTLTPDQETRLLACLDAQGGQATPGQLAAALDLSLPAVRPLLDELMDRGQIRRLQVGVRTVYERVHIKVDPTLVRDDLRPRIRQCLLGRRDTAHGLAAALRETVEEVRETCQAMLLAGELSGTPIGPLYVYGLPEERRLLPQQEVLPPPPVRVPVTPELERQLQAELPPDVRRHKGETTRVAEKYGLTVGQVRAALRRLPVQR